MSKKIRKRIVLVIVIAAVIAAIVGGILLWQTKHAKSVEVYPVSNVYQTYWGDDSTLYGNVTSGKLQTVTLKDSLISSINVKEGDEVKAGDVLMVYDTTSFQLTLQSDQARIAVLEAQIQQNKNNIAKYQGLQPSENAPQPKETVIDHGALNIRSKIDASDFTGDGQTFQCSADTVVTAAFLRQLRSSGASVEFQMYEDNMLYGTWTVDGSALPATRTEYVEIAPVTSDDEDDSAAQATTYTAVETEAIDSDWTLGDSLSFNGDGVSVDLSGGAVGYGQFDSSSPVEYEQYETVYEDSSTDDGSENYMYSKAELAKMIQDEQTEQANNELDLKVAQLTLQQDELVSENGEVVAAVSGTVSEVKDTATLATGDTIFTVKGVENYAVTFYVNESDHDSIQIGDSYTVYAYESSSSSTITVSEIGDTPTENQSSGNDNPNNSYYPVTATVDDTDVQMTLGEWCEVTKNSYDDDSSSSLYLENYFIRKDSGGSYVMLADDSNKLTKQYVSTGKVVYGYMTEIKSGVTLDDRIAVPYGKSVKEGAPVTDGDYPSY
jgi:multidrug efflux pump subunit AcrA (membrane-fusion protein)